MLYRNDAGVATLIGSAPSILAIQAVADRFEEIDSRNDVMVGFMDAARRLGMDLDFAGKLNLGNFKDVVGHILALEAKTAEERVDRSGNKISILDQSDAVAVAIENDGSLINKGRNILAELDAIKSGASNNKWITPSKDIASWGDSMSEDNWQQNLRLLMPDRKIYAGGVGGQKSEQIARRQGGIAPMITVAGNLIPASGGVTVTVDIPFMYSASVLNGRLYGVRGTLSYVAGNLTFTRYQAGTAVQTDPIVPFILTDEEYELSFRTTVIWAGNNDFQPAYRPLIDGNVIRMVEYLKPQEKRFFVIGMAIADYSDRWKGTPYYADTMALHDKWRERWPNNFVDITPIMQRHYNPDSPEDVQNLINGCTPASVRKDAIHFNERGNQIFADTMFSLINQRGW